MRRLLSLFLIAILPAIGWAQVGAPAPMSPAACRAVGLERMWFTQLALDRGRGRLAGIFLHVSAIQSHAVFQVTHENRRYIFSQRDRDAFGKEIGVEGARQAAVTKAAEIKKALEDAGKTDAAAPTLDSFVVPKTTIYASSERGGVYALDGETGRTLWMASIGDPLRPTSTPGANDKYVGVCNGSTLYILRANDGGVAWSKPMVGTPGAGPALTEEYVFTPMISGRVESLSLEESRLPPSLYKAFGRTVVQPVVSSNSVAWPTDSGSLYVALAHSQGLRFRMKATDAINSAPAFLAPDKVFATSIDGYIYCIGESKGNIIWRFSTGEPLSNSPVALGETVYAISERGNLFAVDANSASERWVTGGIENYLAGNAKRLYCLDNRGNLAVLDAASGSRLGSIPSVLVDMPFLNTQTDRILLVNSVGLVQCLRESALPFPVVHYRIEPQKKTTVQLKTKAAEKADQKEADPFGAPGGKAAGTDPFADPGAKGGGGAAGGVDPFAPK
jgi:outer membrane protein assembly factor BamB